MLTESTLTQLLFHYPAFHQMPATMQHLVCQTAVSIDLPANHLLFQEGDSCLSFVMPLSGSIRVVKPDVSGREIMLYRIRPGDSCILTVSCLLGDQMYAARGILDRPVTAVAIPKPLFVDLITHSEPFRLQVFKFFGQRLAQLLRIIEEVTFQKLDQRLATLLLRRGPRLMTTHQQLADELGTVREVINRLLKELKAQGAVEVERGKITVVNTGVLQQLAEVESDFSH